MKIRNIFSFLKEYKNIPFPINGNFNNKNIAIVGNSEILKKKSYGRLIDNFEFVIRFNRSPLIGFEKYVGSKTSLRVCGEGVFENQIYEVPGLEYIDEKANFIKNLNNSNILVLHNNKENFYKSNLNQYTSETNSVFFFDLKYERMLKLKLTSYLNIFERFKIYKQDAQFTSGMIILSMFVNKGFKPSVFGFSLNKNSNFYTSYWQTGGKIKNPVHNLNLENQILRELIKSKKINFYD